MLEQPRSENIGCYFGEDSALLGVLLAVDVIVAAVGAVAAAHARVAGIACKEEEKRRKMLSIICQTHACLRYTRLSLFVVSYQEKKKERKLFR